MGDGKRDANVLIAAGMLAHNSFNVLLYDLRNFGDSDKDKRTKPVLGNKRNIRMYWGAWDYLINVKGYRPDQIGLYGISMGGAATLIAFWTGASRRGCLC